MLLKEVFGLVMDFFGGLQFLFDCSLMAPRLVVIRCEVVVHPAGQACFSALQSYFGFDTVMVPT